MIWEIKYFNYQVEPSMEAAPTESVEGVPATTVESRLGSPQDPPRSTPPVQGAPGPNTVAPSQAQANFEVGLEDDLT